MLGAIVRSKSWQSGLACTAVAGPMVEVPVEFASSASAGEHLPLALAVWAFLGAALWIVQRWGGRPAMPQPEPVGLKPALRSET